MIGGHILFAKLLATVVLLSLMMPVVHVSAATVGYWRFEDSPGFLADSSGNSNTLSTVGTPVQEAIPGSGNGSTFSNPIPLTGATNTDMASNNSSSNFTISGSFNLLDDFTIEAYVNKDNQTTGTQYFVSQWRATAGGRAYAFGVGGSSSAGGGAISPNEMFLLLSDNGNDTIIVSSGLTLNVDTDYFVAVSFDESDQATGVNFYAQDLTNDGPLMTAKLGHSIDSLSDGSASNFRIGAFGSGTGDSISQLQGVIDEVRLSDTALSQNELLIVPEPASLILLLAGAGLTFRRSR